MAETQVEKKKQTRTLFLEALLSSWLAWTALFVMVGVMLSHGSPLISGAAVLIAAILGMNGLARTDMWLTSSGPNWWKKHKILKIFHHITDEGELAGIFVGVVALIMLFVVGEGGHLHFPYMEAFTLLGIMSAANIAVAHMIPIMGIIERFFGIRGVLVLGSLLSSLTGEPAASVFLAEYVKKRVNPEDRPKVATGLAATIGSGGGLMPFAAPPILIVYAILVSEFDWGIPTLIAMVGAGCVAHVITSSFWFSKYIKPREGDRPKMEKKGLLFLGMLAIVVLWHIFYPGLALWIVDGFLGVISWYLAYKKYKDCPEELREDGFTAKWQPIILAVLLVALEIIGVIADPLIASIAGQIPATFPPLLIMFTLFFMTAWVSHFADNALASRVFIMVAVVLKGTFGMDMGSMFAASVVMGALFGGFLLIPANLPNFYLARALKVSPGAWVKVSWILYPSGIAYVAWILSRYFFF
jgi:predicted cation transporter